MTKRLTPSQLDYLRSQPLAEGDPNKLRLVFRLLGTNASEVGDALGISNQQISRYATGSDILLSLAFYIAEALGAEVCDIWPAPPQAKAKRRITAKRAAIRRATKKAMRAKSQVVAA